MNLKVIWTSRFKKDYKLAIKRNLNIELLDDVIRMLAAGQTLPEEPVLPVRKCTWHGVSNTSAESVSPSLRWSPVP